MTRHGPATVADRRAEPGGAGAARARGTDCGPARGTVPSGAARGRGSYPAGCPGRPSCAPGSKIKIIDRRERGEMSVAGAKMLAAFDSTVRDRVHPRGRPPASAEDRS
jgi:hypothetical protein